jgi:hypothetical protein
MFTENLFCKEQTLIQRRGVIPYISKIYYPPLNSKRSGFYGAHKTVQRDNSCFLHADI